MFSRSEPNNKNKKKAKQIGTPFSRYLLSAQQTSPLKLFNVVTQSVLISVNLP